MTIEALLVRYGLIAVLLGSGIEGEAVVVTGGVLAHRGLIPLVPACIAAAVGSCLVDQLWFLAGRRFRHHRWIRAIAARPAFARAMGWLERHPNAFILSFRFIYGMRTVTPVAIGTSAIPARRFVPLNMLAAAIWGPVCTLVGYRLGATAGPLMARIGRDGAIAIGVLVVLLAVALAVGLMLKRRSGAN